MNYGWMTGWINELLDLWITEVMNDLSFGWIVEWLIGVMNDLSDGWIDSWLIG